MLENLEREVSFLCPVCGYDQFSSLDERYPELDEAPDKIMVKCADCGATFSIEELKRYNTEKVEIAFDEFAEEVFSIVEKDFGGGVIEWKL